MPRPQPGKEDTQDFGEELTSKQRESVEALRELLAKPSKLLMWHHAVGQKVSQLRKNTPAWKQGWFHKLAKHLDVSMSTLRKEAVLAKEYISAEVQDLDAKGVGWGMMTVVMHVPKEARAQLLERAVEEKWGVLELKAAARRRFRKRNVGGRPMKRPKSVEAGLKQLQEQARKWLVYYNDVWLCTFRDEWSSLQRKESEAAFQKKLKTARMAVDRVAAATRSIKNTLDELKKGH